MTIPASVTEIGAEAFCNCKQLKRVIFAGDSKLERIGYDAFQNSGLEEITIPSRVTIINCDAFHDCTLLRKVVFLDDSALEKLGG